MAISLTIMSSRHRTMTLTFLRYPTKTICEFFLVYQGETSKVPTSCCIQTRSICGPYQSSWDTEGLRRHRIFHGRSTSAFQDTRLGYLLLTNFSYQGLLLARNAPWLRWAVRAAVLFPSDLSGRTLHPQVHSGLWFCKDKSPQQMVRSLLTIYYTTW